MRATVLNASGEELGTVELELDGTPSRAGTRFVARGMRLRKGVLKFKADDGQTFEGFAERGDLDSFTGVLRPIDG